MPPRTVQGATFCCGHFDNHIEDYIKTFHDRLKTFSYHNYPTSSCHGGSPTLDDLLKDKSTTGEAKRFQPWAKVGRRMGHFKRGGPSDVNATKPHNLAPSCFSPGPMPGGTQLWHSVSYRRGQQLLLRWQQERQRCYGVFSPSLYKPSFRAIVRLHALPNNHPLFLHPAGLGIVGRGLPV
jgi:hypothetical protein